MHSTKIYNVLSNCEKYGLHTVCFTGKKKVACLVLLLRLACSLKWNTGTRLNAIIRILSNACKYSLNVK